MPIYDTAANSKFKKTKEKRLFPNVWKTQVIGSPGTKSIFLRTSPHDFR